MGITDKEIEEFAKDWDKFVARLYILGYRKFSVALKKSIDQVIATLEQSQSAVLTSSVSSILITELPISLAMSEHINLVADRTAKQFFRSYLKYLPDNAGIGVGFGNEMFREGLRKYIETIGADHVKDITETTKRLVKQAFIDSANEKETIKQLAKRIEKYTVGNIGKSRAMLIARTETLMASAISKELQADAMPYVLDAVWVVDNPKEHRSWHLSLNMKKVPKGDKFKVVSPNGVTYMKYAGDSAGGAINVCNCKCTHFYKPRTNKDGDLIKKPN
jgi:hypothetical protein